MTEELHNRKQELLQWAKYYRNLSDTLWKMSEYYGAKYSDALKKAETGDPYAFWLLGQMFEESVHHAHKNRDYEQPPLGYDKLTKIYYELAALGGYSMGAYRLGRSYSEDKEYKQAEKWLLRAAEENVVEAFVPLGKVYHELWKQEGQEKYLEQAKLWKQKALEENESAYRWLDMADFYKDILANERDKEIEDKQDMLSQMIMYYQKASDANEQFIKKRARESLISICLGDYGFEADIEKAFEYGESAVKEGSKYAAFRLGQYLVENSPEEQEKIIYFLERAVDCLGNVDGCKQLLKRYLEEYEIIPYLRAEAVLLLENNHFINLGKMYEQGDGVEKNMKAALYYYTRAMEGTAIEESRDTSLYYSIAYYFMLALEEEGVNIPKEAWHEIESRRTQEKPFYLEDPRRWVREETACVLADLNLKHHIVDMSAFQKQIGDVEQEAQWLE